MAGWCRRIMWSVWRIGRRRVDLEMEGKGGEGRGLG